MRHFIATIAIIMTTVSVPVSVLASAESALTGKTLVDGDVVTVGDLFTNAGVHASHVLAPAPKPGDRLALAKPDFERVARAFRLKWTAPAHMPVIAIERNALAVTVDDITEALAKSDLKEKISDDATFAISNVMEPIIVNGKEPVKLAVTHGRFDAASEEFSATLQVKRDDEVVKEVALQGVATPMVSVPALRYPMMSGNVVRSSDVTEVSVPKKQLRADTIMFQTELVGMTLRRSTQASQSLTQADVVPPVMVKRNELVTITYRNGAIQLSTKARALAAGTRGDTVTFINLTSKKPFDAKVTGPQQAEVNLDG